MIAVAVFVIAWEAVGLVWVATTPSGRDAARRLLTTMRRVYVIYPLRAITGRRAPNYRRIRELERALSR